MKNGPLTFIAAVTLLLLGVASPSAATAASGWWHLTSGARPSVLQPEQKGELVLTALNVGSAPIDGAMEPVTIEDHLPTGLKALSATATAGDGGGIEYGAVPCEVATARLIRCSFAGSLPPFQPIEALVKVEALPAAESGETAELAIAGGGARPLAISRPLPFGEETPYGIEDYEYGPEEAGGSPAAGAGSHPYQITGTVAFNQIPGRKGPRVAQLPKDVNVGLPVGQLGNPSPFPKCTLGEFLKTVEEPQELVDACPSQTAVGIALVTFNETAAGRFLRIPVPVFNLEAGFGEPARFGFWVPGGQVPVLLDTSLRAGLNGEPEDYGITLSTRSISQTVNLLSSVVTFWGVPGDPSHDASRGWGCIEASMGRAHEIPCTPSSATNPPALLTLPASCTGSPLQSSVLTDSWAQPGAFQLVPTAFPPPTMVGCNQVPFAPTTDAEPTSDAATSGTGFNFDLHFENEGLTNSNAGAAAESQVKKAVVTLPQGFTANPSVAEGLKACSEAEYRASTTEVDTGCTAESKIGEVEIESPLVKPVVRGSLYVAKQGENPNHNLLTLYMVARNAELGVIIKQALKVTPNLVTGQLATEVDNIPQLPFSHFRLKFRSGQRSPLITPPSCGTYTVDVDLYPWARPEEATHRESAFQITKGPEGLGCPSGGAPPFHPGLEAGTINNAAGTYSPFYTHITRRDSEQEITHFSIKLPPGLSGRLVGVAQCSDAAIAAAKSREHELGGQEELEHPSCPASSEVGHTLVGTGVGNVLAYAPGKLYLAGPYKGSNLSIVSITAAKVGPFDLGTVVIREGLKVDPTTAQVSVDAAGSDPIPHIVDGIPVHLRDIRIYVDRPNFTLNPTSCERMSTAATVLGSGLDFASEADDQPVTVTSPFQAADCASLGFKPKLTLKLKGKTRRGGLPKLTAVVTYPKGGASANIAKTVVTLPKSEFLEQGHIGSSCTRVQFNAGGGNGEQCPKNSLLGHAVAITPLLEEPIEGPVYLRSNGGERKLPDLVAALHSKDIKINLVGFISSLHKKGSEVSQIQNTFAAVPDAPVEKFTLELFGGKKGLLVNSTNICKGTHKAISEFTGQNGKIHDTEPAVKAQCGKKSKKGKKGKAAKKHGHVK